MQGFAAKMTDRAVSYACTFSSSEVGMPQSLVKLTIS